MLWPVLWLVFLTLLPTLELRFSIPYGFLYYRESMGAASVVGICLLANIALAPVVWVFLDKVVGLFLRVSWIESLYDKVVVRTREKLHSYVERWGTLGLALFIGVPLPGSGVYSGALGAYVLGFGFRQFFIASVLGVLIAGTAVTAVVASGASALDFFIKH